MTRRTKSVTHAEYELLDWIRKRIEIGELRRDMVPKEDDISGTRFDKAATNVLNLISNLAERRRHKLPKDHADYREKS